VHKLEALAIGRAHILGAAGRKVIEHDDAGAVGEESVGQVRADKSRAAGHENVIRTKSRLRFVAQDVL
jgi:hypothetical protein